jgi:hypothetical protein
MHVQEEFLLLLGCDCSVYTLACLGPNVPSSPGEKDGGCCIYLRWEKNGANGNTRGMGTSNNCESTTRAKVMKWLLHP